MSKEEAERINTEIFDKVIHNTSEQTRFINNYVQKIDDLNIDKKNKYNWKDYNGKDIKINEADLAQLYIEKHIDENNLKNLGVDVEKIKTIANTFSEILNDTVNKMDSVYIKYGYAPIEKRKNYFPHFLENKPDTLITKIANALNIDVNPDNLPTDIAGRTETFKPGRAFNRNILQRTTEKTDYNALKALDMYIQGASDIIYHTEDIQNVRALNEAIRDKYRDKKTQEKIENILENTELTEEERQNQIQAIKESQKTPLNNFVTWLDEYANSLANKKSSGDRQTEKDLGRQMYTTMKDIEGKIASNLVGGNMSVALTNFAPLAQAVGSTKLGNLSIGMLQTTQNTINEIISGKSDNFVYESDFLTSRRGSELTQKEKISSKISNILSTPMELIDNFTSESIVRAKYRENVKNGMEHAEALKNADQYTRNLMADRSKGAMPILFDRKNPVMKLITSFQVEPNNIMSNYFKDMPKNSKSNTQLAFQVAKLSVASYAFNALLKSIRGGSDVIPNPIGIVSQLINLAIHNLDDDEDNDEQIENVLGNIAEDILGSIPFGSAISSLGVAMGIDELEDSGRLMVSSAMPDFTKVNKLFDKNVSNEYKKQVIENELTKPLLYLGFPTGGAQVSKTIKGISAYKNGGSYTYKENGEKQLQFPIEKNIPNALKSAIFGKYSLPRSQDYVDNSFKSLNAKQTELYDNSGIDYDTLNAYFDFSKNTVSRDKDTKRVKYLDENNKEYWYDEENKQVYDSEGKKSNVNIKDLNKDTNKEQLSKYINNMKISTDKKWELYKYNVLSENQLETAEEIFKNNSLTKEQYMDLYEKYSAKDIDIPSSKEINKLKEQDIKITTYLKYKADLKKEQIKVDKINEEKEKKSLPGVKIEKESIKKADKIDILNNGNFTDNEKEKLYANYVSDDETYSYISKMDEFDINEYLDYQKKLSNKEFEGDDDPKSNILGKKVTKGDGTAKNKKLKYLLETFSGLELVYLVGSSYAGEISNKDKQALKEFADENLKTEEEQRKFYRTLKDTVEYENGEIKWK